MRRLWAGWALVLVMLFACTSETVVSTSPPAAVPSASSFGSGGSTWHFVAVGDSISYGKDCPGCATFVDLFAGGLARRAGVTVSRTNWSVPGLSTGRLLEMVQHHAGLRSDLAGADVVTVTIGVNDLPWNPGINACGATPREGQIDWTKITPGCLSQTARQYGDRLGRILDEIGRLRAGKPTLLLLTGIYDEWIGRPGVPADALTIVARGVRLFDRAEWRDAAVHDGAVADLFHAFNGPSGRDDAGRFLEPSHGVHPNQRGHGVIAGALFRLGLAPLRG
jgi:lysophospholipase L1-like esterase